MEDIRVSYNSTAANRTSNLNLLAGVTVNVSDDCIVIEKSPCQIPNFGIYQCRTPNFDFIDQVSFVLSLLKSFLIYVNIIYNLTNVLSRKKKISNVNTVLKMHTHLQMMIFIT